MNSTKLAKEVVASAIEPLGKLTPTELVHVEIAIGDAISDACFEAVFGPADSAIIKLADQ